MTLRWLTALIFIGISSIINGQPALNDTIFFMNGDILQCDIIDDSQIEVVFEFQKRKRRKQLGVHKSEIFGIINNGVKYT
jgi:hypothetical protein